MEASVKSENKNGIISITFFHPQGNSLPGTILRKLAEEILAAGNNTEAKVILLKSEGNKAFCGGASFDELLAIRNFEEGKKFFSGFAMVINAIRTVSKFVIVRVQGKAVGGGVGLAAAADYALAVKDASIRLSELALGIGPFVVGPAVERKVGTAAFTALTINPTEWKSANWAREKGLYADVFSSSEELNQAVDSLTEKLSQSSPDAMTELKKVMWAGTENWDQLLMERAELSGRLVLSDFTKNYIEQFKAREKK